MDSLFNRYDLQVDRAYIIRVVDNKQSEALAKRCADSCDSVKQSWSYWDAYDGYSRKIKIPDHSRDNPVMKMLKVTDHYLTRGEVACALSHISLWSLCAAEDRPIVILEHDAVMVRPYTTHSIFNSICYLGGHEQHNLGWPVRPTPPHASEGPNYHFICRAHAYAIDPAVARNLISHVIKFGICAPLDIMIRADVFSIHQMGLYAYDVKEREPDGSLKTTILGRPLEGRTTIRNDDLSL